MSMSGRVLVVDDDPDLRAFLRDLLSGYGYDVAAVGDAESAREMLGSEGSRPELVLLDLAMPGTNGFDLLCMLRNAPETRDLPALVISGFTRREYAATCLERGADDYISKPFDGRELVARVQSHLRRARERHQWRTRSCTDPLTGLLNRRAFLERLEQEIVRAGRECRGLAVSFIDVDSFKQINDELGHAVGDLVLQLVAHELSGTLRRCDLPARWGGDEFVVALPGADRHKAADAIERLRRGVLEHSTQLLPRPVGLSVGVGCLGDEVAPTDKQTALRLVEAADRSMYADKRRRSRRRFAEGTRPRVPNPECS